MATIATAGTIVVNELYSTYFETRAEQGLFSKVFLYELADKHPLPGGNGKTIYIPKHLPLNNIAALTDGTIVTTCATSADFYSGTIAGYGAANRYSDFLMDINQVPGHLGNDAHAFGEFLGYKYDDILSNVINAGNVGGTAFTIADMPAWVGPNGTTAEKAVTTTTNLLQRFFFDAFSTLATNDAPQYVDGMYAAVIHPAAAHDIFVNTSDGQGFGSDNFMVQTEHGLSTLERATIGVLGGCRILVSSKAKALYTATDETLSAGFGMDSADSGYQALVMGPGAMAAVDLNTARPRIYTKGFGSSGHHDPIEQQMTLGIKGYFTGIKMDNLRVIRSASGKTID